MLLGMSFDEAPPQSSDQSALAVLYADIAGSTRLYEQHGDAVAQKVISSCLALLKQVAERSGGRVVKSIGDEIQCVFEDPAMAMMAGTDMQAEVENAGVQKRFETGALRIKVGFHYGPAHESNGEIHGQAALIAQDVIKLAKPDQVLTSAPTLDAVPRAFRLGARQVDELRLDGSTKIIDVYEIIWDEISVTQESIYKPSVDSDALRCVILNYKGKKLEVDEKRPTITIGRVKSNDIVTPTDLTSRMHAEIHFRRGRCYITDVSINGTLVIDDSGKATALRRERFPLKESGQICVGGGPEKNPDGVIDYLCVKQSKQ